MRKPIAALVKLVTIYLANTTIRLLEEERMYLTIHIRLVVNKGSKMPLEKTPEKGGQNS